MAPPGASTIKTKPFALAQRACDDIVRRRGMGVLYGDAGTGKSYAAQTWLERARAQTERVTRIELPSDPTPRYVASTLHRALTGDPGAGSLFAITDELLDLLAEPQMLILDEAQRLRYQAVEFLRHLYDAADTDIALMLVGGNGCWEVISRHPMLLSRVWRPVRFRALVPEEVDRIIPRYHPIYADAHLDVIRLIDDEFAHGNLRDWSGFTATAAEICDEHDLSAITEQVVRSAFVLHGGGLGVAA